jgi:hypothetical protein
MTVRSRISRGEQTSRRRLAVPAWPGERLGYGQVQCARTPSTAHGHTATPCSSDDEGEPHTNFFRKGSASASPGNDKPLSRLPVLLSHQKTISCGRMHTRTLPHVRDCGKAPHRATAPTLRWAGALRPGVMAETASCYELIVAQQESGRQEAQALGVVARRGAPSCRKGGGRNGTARNAARAREPWPDGIAVRVIGTRWGRKREMAR